MIVSKERNVMRKASRLAGTFMDIPNAIPSYNGYDGTFPVRDATALSGNWKVVAANGSLCAHFEHTNAVTEGGNERSPCVKLGECNDGKR